MTSQQLFLFLLKRNINYDTRYYTEKTTIQSRFYKTNTRPAAAHIPIFLEKIAANKSPGFPIGRVRFGSSSLFRVVRQLSGREKFWSVRRQPRVLYCGLLRWYPVGPAVLCPLASLYIGSPLRSPPSALCSFLVSIGTARTIFSMLRWTEEAPADRPFAQIDRWKHTEKEEDTHRKDINNRDRI